MRKYIDLLVESENITEEQKFDVQSNKNAILTFINNVLSGNESQNNKQSNPFYQIIVGGGKVGDAERAGLKELKQPWRDYFTSKPWLTDGGPWSQINLGNTFSKSTGQEKTLNFYVTVTKDKQSILNFYKNIYKLAELLDPISKKFQTPIAFKTHGHLDNFIGHNDSLKVYYYDQGAGQEVKTVVEKWLKDNAISVGQRTHTFGVDKKGEGGGSYGQILSNSIYDFFTKYIKDNKGYTAEQYYQWFEKQLPNIIRSIKVSTTNEDKCPKCGGPLVSEDQLNEKQDACYHKVRSRYKVWPSAYASGALVQCRKKGAANWGKKKKKKKK